MMVGLFNNDEMLFGISDVSTMQIIRREDQLIATTRVTFQVLYGFI